MRPDLRLLLPVLAISSFWIAGAASASAAGNDDKLLAPPPREVDGLTAVPIDVVGLNASLVFDAESHTASVNAELTFDMTEAEGFPVFDLRQPIRSARLNGEGLEPARLASHAFSNEAGSLRIIEAKLEPLSRNVLELEYVLGTPQAPGCRPLRWGEGTLTWDTWFSDLYPGRYLEMWFPANLIYDRFPFTLTLELAGAQAEHYLLTNGKLETLAEHKWRMSFPPTFTAFSPMIVLVPAADVERSSSEVALPGGRKVTVDVCSRLEAGGVLSDIHAQVEREMLEFTESTGSWPHGDRFTVYVWTGGRSMEYDGATTTSLGALRHEFFHSWYGRGVKPRSQNDGWIDEAWDVYCTEPEPPVLRDPAREGRPVVLCSDDPWNRVTPMTSYSLGSRLFARIAEITGPEKLRALMARFFQDNALALVSTADLERHLYCATKDPRIRQLFHRYAYGREGELEKIEVDCPE